MSYEKQFMQVTLHWIWQDTDKKVHFTKWQIFWSPHDFANQSSSFCSVILFSKLKDGHLIAAIWKWIFYKCVNRLQFVHTLLFSYFDLMWYITKSWRVVLFYLLFVKGVKLCIILHTFFPLKQEPNTTQKWCSNGWRWFSQQNINRISQIHAQHSLRTGRMRTTFTVFTICQAIWNNKNIYFGEDTK